MTCISKAAMLTALGAVFAASAGAQNLVTNPGFETGDFTGWTTNSAGPFDPDHTSVDTANPHSGNYSAFFGADDGSDRYITQSLSTVPGGSYTVTFWLEQGDDSENSFTASFGGGALLSLSNSGPFSYTQYSYVATANTSTTALTFSAQNPPDYWYLDDISVTANSPNPVPEPVTSALALAGVGLAARRRRKRA